MLMLMSKVEFVREDKVVTEELGMVHKTVSREPYFEENRRVLIDVLKCNCIRAQLGKSVTLGIYAL
jgi:hypothetical protein